MTDKKDDPPTPTPISITSHNQRGGVTAHTVNIGKVPFVMEEMHMQAVADHYGGARPLTIGWVASEASRLAASALAAFLRARGFAIGPLQAHMQYVPPEPNDNPIMIVGDTIMIDANK